MIVPAGRINKLFGTEGGVMLSLYPAFPEDFTTETPLFVTIDSLEVPLWCERFERRGISGATATFADFDTERRAQELLGLEFRIGQAEAEDDDEFYLEDLIGFAVTAEELGTVETDDTQATQAAAGTDQTGTAETQTVASASDSETGAARTAGKWHGTVTDYYDSDMNPLFELEIDGRQVLVPAVEEFIAHIDFEGRTMHLVLPEGLIGLE